MLTGLTPLQGFVVCIEADGCVSIEVKASDATCGGCAGHDEDDAPSPALDSANAVLACPCIDLPVSGARDEQVRQARTAEFRGGPWLALVPELVVRRAAPLAAAVREPPSLVPRVADSLAHLRSVVLLV
jgi:hypothetical protein